MATILVVEDEEDIREIVGEMIETVSDGTHTVNLAANGEEGLAVFRSQKPDLIISDFNMPGMNGNELAAIVFKENPGQPFIGMTGKITENQAPFLEAGVTNFLPKPFKMAELGNLIEKALVK